eukprot:9836-Amphidinium_carterae.1
MEAPFEQHMCNEATSKNGVIVTWHVWEINSKICVLFLMVGATEAYHDMSGSQEVRCVMLDQALVAAFQEGHRSDLFLGIRQNASEHMAEKVDAAFWSVS